MKLEQEQEWAIEWVGRHDNRGLSPRECDLEDHRRLKSLLLLGLVKKPSRSWGWRLTDSGEKILADIRQASLLLLSRMKAAGVDPHQKISDMTPEDIAAFKRFSATERKETK